MKAKVFRRLVSFVATFAILFNALTPTFIALAQEEPTPTPTPTPEESATPTAEPTVAPSEEPTASPEVSPSAEATPVVEETVAPTPVEEVLPTQTENTDSSSQTTNENAQPQAPPSESPSVEPSPTITPVQPIEEGNLSTTLVQEGESYPIEVQNYDGFTVTTDKLDYAPTETAIITGTNFTPGETYSLTVSSSDEPATSTTVSVTADQNGEFVYAYQLDGIYRPNYKVEVKDGSGNVVASITFTDAQTITAAIDEYSQCANDDGDGYSTGDTGCQWINGNLQSNNSAYYEGDATVQRLAIKDLTTGDHTVTIKYGTTKGGKHAYDFITDDKFSENWISDADMCDAPLDELGSCSSLTPVDSGLIPTDPNAAGHDTALSARHFRIRNGTWSNTGTIVSGIASGPTLTSGTYAGDSETTIQLKFHVDTATCADVYNAGTNQNPVDACEVLITFGAHVSSQIDWGVGTSAVNIDGSPYHVSLEELDGGSAGSRDNQMQASAIIPPSTITINKITDPIGGTGFGFTTTGLTPSTFTLDDTETQTFISVIPGQYAVSEDDPSPYSLTSLICGTVTGEGTSATPNLGTRSVSITIGPEGGANVDCTFTNTLANGHIVVDKITNPSGSNQSFSFDASGGSYADFSLTDAATPNDQELTPGTYSVSETVPTGWDLTSTSCVSSIQDTETAGNLELDPGETITCTFTNTQRGHIIVDKVTDPTGDSQSFDFDASGGTYSDFSLTDAATPNDQELVPGNYSVSETEPSGWDLTDTSCVSSLGDNETAGSLELDAGETITCTFTNTKLGSISGYKFEDADGNAATTGDQAVLSGWVIQLWQWVTDTFVNTGLTDTTDGSGLFSFENLFPGLYQLREVLQAGWTQILPSPTSNNGNIDVTLTAGENDQNNNFANFENVDVTACKVADPDGNIETETDRTNVAGWQMTLTKNGQTFDTQDTLENGCYTWTDLGPGGYSVTEETQTGWTNLNPTTHDFGTVQSGETYTHTFVNTELGSITITKETSPDGSLQEFNFNLTGGATDSSLLSDGESDTYDNLLPGSYTITETIPTGWSTAVSVLCDRASYGHPTVLSLAAGQHISCTYTNTQLGQIIIEKQTEPNGSSQSFHFSASYDGDGFDLTDGVQNNSGYLPADTYSVSEVVPEGWDLTPSTCSDQSDPSSISLQAGETVTCIFTNTQRGHIIVDKVTDPSGDTQNFDFDATGGSYADFALTDTDTPNDQELVPGTYGVSETVPIGWDLTNTSCVSSLDESETVDNLDLDAGETITCTFTNQKDSGIVVIKQTDPDGSQQSFEFDSDYHNDNFFLTDGFFDLSGDLLPGTYSVVELTPTGWDLTSATCDDGSDPSSISLQAGETIVCTFTNTQRGHIIVDKVTDPTGSEQSFDFDATGGDYADFSLTDAATPNDQALVPGSYGISETTPAGWDLTDVTCVSSLRDNETADNLELDAGETITCTFTNTELGNILVVKYNDHDGNGTKDDGDEVLDEWEMHLVGDEVDAYQWTGNGDPAVSGQVTFSDVMPGEYTLSEQIKEGWDQTNISCGDEEGIDNDNSHAFTLAAGQDLTCYVGNQGQGTVTVNKDVDTDGDGQVDIFGSTDWLFELDTADYTMGTTVPVAAGLHNLAEFQNEGYHFVSLYCDDVDQEGDSTTIEVGPGDDVVCTYTNARDTGTIIVHKIIDADGNLDTTDDQTPGEDWEMTVEGNSEDTSNPEPQNTGADGSTIFDDLKTGEYNVFEDLQDGYDMLDAYCDDENGSWDGGLYGVEVGIDDTVNCTFINSPNGGIHGRKWDDEDGDGLRGQEDLLGGWTINLYKWDEEDEDYTDFVDSTTTDSNEGPDFGWYWFTHLFPGDYKVCEELQAGWNQTYPLGNDGCHLVTIPDQNLFDLPQESNFIETSPVYDFGNQEGNPGITIEKSNDSPNDSAGGTVNYTLLITNTGNQTIYNLDIIDVLPGGFTYITGTTTGATTSDPVVAGSKLTWEDVTNLGAGDSITLSYQAQIASDVVNGTYTNFATCSGELGGRILLTALIDQIGGSTINCNEDDSSVTIGSGTNFGGNLVGQVLGASTELPATGTPTALLAVALGLLGTGVYLRKKHAKN